MMKKGVLGSALTFLAFMIFTTPVLGQDVALQAVQGHVDNVLAVLTDPALKGAEAKEAKAEKIKGIAEKMFDYNELSRRTLGRNWDKLNPKQQEEFTTLFSALLSSVYLDKILQYSDEKVVFEKSNPLSEEKVEVQSNIITSTKTIPVFYRTILKDNQWRVYDVIIEGISLVKNYRSQFKDILAKKSPEKLLEILRSKSA